MLTAREAFKTGFLARCAEQGMTNSQILVAVKTANDKVAGLTDLPVEAAKGLFRFGTGTLLPAALLAPPILGGLAGYGAAKATDISDEDIDDIKDREVINTYKTESDKLQRQRAVRTATKLRQQRPGARMHL